MSWVLYRWTWLLESPLYVGTVPSGSLNRCRLYVPSRVLWGALTAELARKTSNGVFPAYDKVGEEMKKTCRFSYLFPAERDGQHWRAWLPRYEKRDGLVWRREDRLKGGDLPDRRMRIRLLATRPATAIDPSSDTAAEGTLRETECVNIRWREETNIVDPRVAFAGYVLLEPGAPQLSDVDFLAVGGDTRYGLGQLRRHGEFEPASDVFGYSVELDGSSPVIKADRLLAHGSLPRDVGAPLCGELEALGGWEYGKSGVQPLGGPLWRPGSSLETQYRWTIEETGHWQALGGSN